MWLRVSLFVCSHTRNYWQNVEIQDKKTVQLKVELWLAITKDSYTYVAVSHTGVTRTLSLQIYFNYGLNQINGFVLFSSLQWQWCVIEFMPPAIRWDMQFSNGLSWKNILTAILNMTTFVIDGYQQIYHLSGSQF